MNHAARFVLWVLGVVLILFSLDIVLAPLGSREPAKAATDNLATLIVAFVGILAKTGPTDPPSGSAPVTVVNGPGNPIPTDPQ